MLFLRHLLLASSLLTCSSARPGSNQERSLHDESFKARLASVSDDSLHAALHFVHPAYKDGVFDDDRTAAQKIHKKDPLLAERILVAAIPEVGKRQNMNANTSTSSSEQTQSRPATVRITSTTVVTSIQVTSVSGSPSIVKTTVVSTLTRDTSVAPFPSPTPSVPSVVPAPSSSSMPGSLSERSTIISSIVAPPPSSSSSPAPVPSSSSSLSSSSLSSTLIQPSPSPSSTPVIPGSTSSAPQPSMVGGTLTQVVGKTVTPGQSTVLSTRLATATASLPDALTETDQVTQDASTAPTVPGGAKFSTGPKPALQTAGANGPTVMGKEFLAIMGGAVGVAWML